MLVVTVDNFKGKSWLDRGGNFNREDLRLTEHFTPITVDAIRYEVTIEDPKTFSRPWKISMPMYRRLEPNAKLLEHRCIEFVRVPVWKPSQATVGQALGGRHHHP